MDIRKQIIANQNPIRTGKIKVCRQWEDLLFFSGHGCEDNFTGEPLAEGKLGADISFEQGCEMAKACALILIDAIQDELGDLDRVESIVHAFALINCTDDFTQHDEVMDRFSEVMASVFGERGIHSRMVGGAASLPYHIPVEVELIVQVKP